MLLVLKLHCFTISKRSLNASSLYPHLEIFQFFFYVSTNVFLIILGCVFIVISQVEKASTSSAQLPELGDNATALIRELQEATPLSLGLYQR